MGLCHVHVLSCRCIGQLYTIRGLLSDILCVDRKRPLIFNYLILLQKKIAYVLNSRIFLHRTNVLECSRTVP